MTVYLQVSLLENVDSLNRSNVLLHQFKNILINGKKIDKGVNWSKVSEVPCSRKQQNLLEIRPVTSQLLGQCPNHTHAHMHARTHTHTHTYTHTHTHTHTHTIVGQLAIVCSFLFANKCYIFSLLILRSILFHLVCVSLLHGISSMLLSITKYG